MPRNLANHPSPGVRFGLGFAGWLLVFSLAFWALDLHLHLGGLQQMLARSGAWLDNLFGGSARAQDIDILLGGPILTINHECTGIFLVILFMSFVLAYPASVRARSTAILFGLPLLQGVNVVRLGVLGRLLEVYPDAFVYFHEYVWQGIFMVIILLGCLTWAENVELQ